MKHRDFLRFMGVSAGSKAAATTLAKLPETEQQIILLDKPKGILLPGDDDYDSLFDEVDFIISNVTSVSYTRQVNSIEQVSRIGRLEPHVSGYGSEEVTIVTEAMFVDKNLFQLNIGRGTFAFNFEFNENGYETGFTEDRLKLTALNGRKFLTRSYEITNSTKQFAEVIIEAVEVARDSFR